MQAVLASPMLVPVVILLLCAGLTLAAGTLFMLSAGQQPAVFDGPIDLEEVELTAISKRIVKLSDKDRAILRQVIEHTVSLLEDGRLVRIEP